MFTTQDVQARLTQFYQTRLADAFIKVSDVEPVTGGWEALLYKFRLHTQNADSQALILRLYHGNRDEKAQHEFTAMQGLKRLGYPVPNVYHLIPYAESLFDGSCFMMDVVEGRSLAAVAGEGEMITGDLLKDYCRLMVDLHTLRWQSEFSADFDTNDPYGAIDTILSTLKHAIQHTEFADFTPLLDWIRARRGQIPCPQFSLTHNDFHADNVLVKDDGAMVVIDWPSMSISDYRVDLAWVLVLEGTYLSQAASDAIFYTYQSVRGEKVENLDVFLVLAMFRRLTDLAEVMQPNRIHGLRPDVIKAMRADADHYRACYAWLVEITGIQINGIEDLLAAL